MSFGSIKTRLRALINRKDFTDELAEAFIIDAIGALERDLRIGAMEAVLAKTEWDGTDNIFPVPSGYLQGINFFTDEGPIDETSLAEFLKDKRSGSVPTICTRVGDRWIVKPTPQAGTTVYLHFYAETFRPTLDTDESIWTTAGLLATLYKAAEIAADFYQMEPDIVAGYSNKAQVAAESIAGQAISEAFSGRMAIPLPNIGDF